MLANKIIVDIGIHLGELGVNCFILISGYFWKDTHFRWRKVVLMSLAVEFYLILNRCMLVGVGWADWRTWPWKSYLFPIMNQRYWFISAYVITYLLTPYLHVMLSSLQQEEWKRLVVTVLIVWCVIPTLFGFFYPLSDTERMAFYSRFVWMFVMYCVGAYIHEYGCVFTTLIRNSLIGLGLSAVVLVVYILCIEFQVFSLVERNALFFFGPNSLLQVIASICVFALFLSLRLPYIRIINYLASCMMGVYMFHDGEARMVFWEMIFRNASHTSSRFLCVHVAIAVFVIMLLGILIESARKFLEKVCIGYLISKNNYKMED